MDESAQEVEAWAGMIDSDTGQPLSNRTPIRLIISRPNGKLKVERALSALRFKSTEPKPFKVAFFWERAGGEPFHVADAGQPVSAEVKRVH